jgi:hypothetical protein
VSDVVFEDAWPSFAADPRRLGVLATGLTEGAPLGTTRDGRAATLALVGPAPVRIAVVGQAWLASLLAVRAAVLGASVIVVTERPAPWHLLLRAAGGQPFATVVAPGTPAGAAPPSITTPVLTLHDGGAGAEAALARAPWQTSVHLLFRVGGQPTAVLDAADVVLVPAVPAEEVPAVAQALRLPEAIAAQLPGLGPVEVLAASRNRTAVVTVQATPSELALLRAGDLTG